MSHTIFSGEIGQYDGVSWYQGHPQMVTHAEERRVLRGYILVALVVLEVAAWYEPSYASFAYAIAAWVLIRMERWLQSLEVDEFAKALIGDEPDLAAEGQRIFMGGQRAGKTVAMGIFAAQMARQMQKGNALLNALKKGGANAVIQVKP